MYGEPLRGTPQGQPASATNETTRRGPNRDQLTSPSWQGSELKHEKKPSPFADNCGRQVSLESPREVSSVSGAAEKKGRERQRSILREGFVWFSWSENKNRVNHVSLVLLEENAPSSQTRIGARPWGSGGARSVSS